MQAPSLCHQDPQPQKYDTPWEASYQRFSQYQYEEAAGPREAFCTLWELCIQWLKPYTRSVEQILALFVMEKFLQIIPARTGSSLSLLNEESRERLFTLIEDLRKDNREPENKINVRDILLEELVPMSPLLTQSDMEVDSPAFQLMEIDQELQDILPAEPEEMNIDNDNQCLTFLNIAFHFSNEYEYLEPPGEEPPEQLLADINEPEEMQESSESQDQQEVPGTSREAQGPINSAAPTQARPNERPLCSEQLGLCSAHRQQRNIHVEIHAGRVAREGPRNRAGPSYGPVRCGRQFVSHEHAVCSNSFRQAATVSRPLVDYFDQERQQCRLCKREFMYKLGLQEHVKTQVVSKPYQCPYCGKTFRGQSHVVAHLVKHTEERPFLCQYCQKSYKHKSSLLRHLKIHKREGEHKENQGSQNPMHNTN